MHACSTTSTWLCKWNALIVNIPLMCPMFRVVRYDGKLLHRMLSSSSRLTARSRRAYKDIDVAYKKGHKSNSPVRWRALSSLISSRCLGHHVSVYYATNDVTRSQRHSTFTTSLLLIVRAKHFRSRCNHFRWRNPSLRSLRRRTPEMFPPIRSPPSHQMAILLQSHVTRPVRHWCCCQKWDFDCWWKDYVASWRSTMSCVAYRRHRLASPQASSARWRASVSAALSVYILQRTHSRHDHLLHQWRFAVSG